MSTANPNPMEKSMVSVLVVENAGGGSPLLYGVPPRTLQEMEWRTSAIADKMESAFQTVLNKLENLTKQVDKMALED
jgi:hypothetical protein